MISAYSLIAELKMLNVSSCVLEYGLMRGDRSLVELYRNSGPRLPHKCNQPRAVFKTAWPFPKTQTIGVGSYTSFIWK